MASFLATGNRYRAIVMAPEHMAWPVYRGPRAWKSLGCCTLNLSAGDVVEMPPCITPDDLPKVVGRVDITEIELRTARFEKR